MRISLLLNATMSKSCAQSHSRFQQEKKSHLLHFQDNRRPIAYEGSGCKQKGFFDSGSGPVSPVQQFLGFLSACNELKWYINSRTTLSQALDAAVQQIYSLSVLLLFYLTLVLVTVQFTGLVLMLSCSASLPFGLQFMIASVIVISAAAFQIMYQQ